MISLFGADEPTTVALHTDVMTHFASIEIFFLLFLVATILVTARGINRGLEKISWIVVPTYFFILLGLAIYTCTHSAFSHSVEVLFSKHPDQSFLTVMTAAMIYVFFKLIVFMVIMIFYGSYLPYSANFRRSTLLIVLFDALISLLSYFIIYPLMLQSNAFIYNLTNHNIIYLFSGVPNGFIIAALFFLAAVMAAWMCTIAMAETVVVTLIERFGIPRVQASIVVFIGAAIIGSFAALTHTEWMHVMINPYISLQGIIKNVTGNLLIPVSAILIAIFIGWIVNKKVTESELEFNPVLYRIWSFLVKIIAPLLIIAAIISVVYNML